MYACTATLIIFHRVAILIRHTSRQRTGDRRSVEGIKGTASRLSRCISGGILLLLPTRWNRIFVAERRMFRASLNSTRQDTTSHDIFSQTIIVAILRMHVVSCNSCPRTLVVAHSTPSHHRSIAWRSRTFGGGIYTDDDPPQVMSTSHDSLYTFVFAPSIRATRYVAP